MRPPGKRGPERARPCVKLQRNRRHGSNGLLENSPFNSRRTIKNIIEEFRKRKEGYVAGYPPLKPIERHGRNIYYPSFLKGSDFSPTASDHSQGRTSGRWEYMRLEMVREVLLDCLGEPGVR